MFYRLSCGCIVLPLATQQDGWRVIDIDRCDKSQYDETGIWIGREYVEPFDPYGAVGSRKIEDGAKLTPEQDANIFEQLRSLLNDGYRFRELRRALDPKRDMVGGV